MTKEVLYSYLGTNGTITSPVHLEDVYYIRKIRLTADIRKMLTKDNKVLYRQVTVPEGEEDQWFEIALPEKE